MGLVNEGIRAFVAFRAVASSAARARLRLLVTSLSLDLDRVAVGFPCSPAASLSCFFSFLSLGTSRISRPSSRASRTSRRARLAMNGLVSIPWSASTLLGSEVMTRVACTMARNDEP